MKYRRFGKLEWQASALGFGAMRLPIIEGDPARIDEPEATKMIEYAIDHGVNYLDNAYPYHRGNSEALVGRILQKGYRKKVRIATKMPCWLVNSQQDMDKYFDEQLRRLQVDYVDFYLFHGLNKERWQKLTELGALEWAERRVDEGRIKHLGFSFHDAYQVFKEIVDSYNRWTMCQILYNYMDSDFQAGTKGLRYAASKGLAVVVMEPIAGGRLATKPLDQVQAVWDSAEKRRTPVDWALQWVWNHPEVSVVLSGMSTMQQVVENVKSADLSGPRNLSRKELAIIKRAAQKYRELGFVACSACRYCLPCPQGVNIPQIISLYNEFYMKDRSDEVKSKYWEYVTPESQAKRCARCKQCENLCPQQLPVSDIMSRAAMIFEEKE
jgi:predicted aldo/keto reductase-like oxidoreductase